MKIIIGVSGASGAVLAKRLLEELKGRKIETHLVISDSAKMIIKHELGADELAKLEKLATKSYGSMDFYAAISSGSFKTDGMVVIPCSMKTVGAIANGVAHNLLVRAAEVCLKQERKVVLVPREAPLSLIDLENLVRCKRAGCSIIPPVLAFYPKPESVDDCVDFVVGKVLDSLNLENTLYKHWEGSERH